MKILYFARIRAQIGQSVELLEKPSAMTTVADLIASLKARGGGYEAALADPAAVKVAINHDYVGLDHPVTETDEIALFPPVTGG